MWKEGGNEQNLSIRSVYPLHILYAKTLTYNAKDMFITFYHLHQLS
jgi:hypothetical protein